VCALFCAEGPYILRSSILTHPHHVIYIACVPCAGCHRAIVTCLGEDVKEWVRAYPVPAAALSDSVLDNLAKLQHALCMSVPPAAVAPPARARASSPISTPRTGESYGEEEEEEEEEADRTQPSTPSPPAQHLVRYLSSPLCIRQLCLCCCCHCVVTHTLRIASHVVLLM
jgi:ribosomal protein L12E/L44/L45/RPP1/RPP2